MGGKLKGMETTRHSYKILIGKPDGSEDLSINGRIILKAAIKRYVFH
jgi:hypothetical protein